MAEPAATAAPVAAEDVATGVAALAISDAAAAEASAERSSEASDETPAVPPHRSHDPETNQKRTDPFMFGQRFLTQGDDVFEFNAWDHVETDDAFKEYAEKQYELQRSAPVSDFDKCKCAFCFSSWFSFSSSFFRLFSCMMICQHKA